MATYDIAWDWDGPHQISPRKYRWTPLSRVYETICFRHSHSFVKLWCAFVELYLWDQLTRNLFEIWRNLYILLETFDMRCCFFLITMFAATCFIGHFSSLMKPWYWGIPPSLRLSSLGFDFFYIGRHTEAYPLGRSYPIFFTIIFIGVQSHHFHRHSKPPLL